MNISSLTPRLSAPALSSRPQQVVSAPSTPEPAEVVTLTSEPGEGTIPDINLRPDQQHRSGLKGALAAIGGVVGWACAKVLGKFKGPMMRGAWEDLLVASYEVPPQALHPYLPEGVELDTHGGKSYVSLVAFNSKDIKGFGVPIPSLGQFEQVNLRFYVKRDTPEGPKKGVAFIKEIVPKPLMALVSRSLLNETYVEARMDHAVPPKGQDGRLSFEWQMAGSENRMTAERNGEPESLAEGSLEEFLLENYYGYSRQRDGKTVEYLVEHPPWKVWTADNSEIRVDAEKLYGAELARYLNGPPASVVIADGSQTAVYPPKEI